MATVLLTRPGGLLVRRLLPPAVYVARAAALASALAAARPSSSLLDEGSSSTASGAAGGDAPATRASPLLPLDFVLPCFRSAAAGRGVATRLCAGGQVRPRCCCHSKRVVGRTYSAHAGRRWGSRADEQNAPATAPERLPMRLLPCIPPLAGSWSGRAGLGAQRQ